MTAEGKRDSFPVFNPEANGLTAAQGMLIEGFFTFNLLFVALSCHDTVNRSPPAVMASLPIASCIAIGAICAVSTNTAFDLIWNHTVFNIIATIDIDKFFKTFYTPVSIPVSSCNTIRFIHKTSVIHPPLSAYFLRYCSVDCWNSLLLEVQNATSLKSFTKDRSNVILLRLHIYCTKRLGLKSSFKTMVVFLMLFFIFYFTEPL